MVSKDLRVTHNAYFSLLRHAKQLLFFTFCDTTAGIGSRTGWMGQWKEAVRLDRHEVWNSYIDIHCGITRRYPLCGNILGVVRNQKQNCKGPKLYRKKKKWKGDNIWVFLDFFERGLFFNPVQWLNPWRLFKNPLRNWRTPRGGGEPKI